MLLLLLPLILVDITGQMWNQEELLFVSPFYGQYKFAFRLPADSFNSNKMNMF